MKALLYLVLMCSVGVLLQAQEERQFIRKGNAEFTAGKFLESEIEFRKALEKDAKSFEAQFNVGDALFRQKKYDKAAEQFEVLSKVEKDPSKLAQVYHNLGNSLYAQGKIKPSIEAYKNALRNNPLDNDARYNLIAALKALDNQEKNKDKNQQDSDNDGIPDEKEKQDNKGASGKDQDTDNDGIPDYKSYNFV